MRVSDLLHAVRGTLEAPENWCQGTSARDAKGVPCNENSKAAASWCLLGAVYINARNLHGYTDGKLALKEAAKRLGLPHSDQPSNTAIFKFNDDETTTHEMVLRLIDEAIRAEEAKK